MLTVMIIQHIVSPARNLKTDEMFADVEIQRYDRVIGEQHALSLFEVHAPQFRVCLLGSRKQ